MVFVVIVSFGPTVVTVGVLNFLHSVGFPMKSARTRATDPRR